jgi:hypothetical protein
MSNAVGVLKNTQEASSMYLPSSSSSHTHTTQIPSIPTYPPSISTYPPSHYMYLTQPSLTSTYPSLFLNNDLLSQTANTSTLKVVPELKEFLERLDTTYGNGKYTQYLEIFEEHDIRVSLIPKISDEWWEKKLQITSLGHILTLKDEAKKYV